MRDLDEGVSTTGMIVTGISRSRVPAAFEPVVGAAAREFRAVAPIEASLHLYGSVATGRGRTSRSDVDLLTLGLPATVGAAMSARLSLRFADRCRSVDIACTGFGDLLDEGDEAYGNRVFLRHYCLLLVGPDPVDRSVEYPADLRAARGFNGDIAQHLHRWRASLATGADPSTVGRTAARKSLLAVAGLVSVHDRAWTTDRVASAERWSTIDPPIAVGLATLLDWIDRDDGLKTEQVGAALDGPVAAIVDTFDRTIGLWR